jgi:hypothetical protein
MKKYINPLLTFGTTMALLYVIYGQNEQLTKLESEQVKVYKVPAAVDSLQSIIDSLQSEAFSAQTQNGRYELSLEYLYEVNPNAGKQFTTFMEQETE